MLPRENNFDVKFFKYDILNEERVLCVTGKKIVFSN